MNSVIPPYVNTRHELVEKLTRVIVDDLVLEWSPREIDPDAPLFGTGLQLDSIDAVELVVCVERAFEIKLSSSFNIYDMRTINKMADAILKAGEEVTHD